MSVPDVLLLRLLHPRPAALVARLVVVELVPRCHPQPWLLLWWQSDSSDERGVVQCDPEVDLLSLRVDGRDLLIPRGLSELDSFP